MHIMQLVRRCSSAGALRAVAASLPQSNTARERARPRAIISPSASAPRGERVPSSDRKKDLAPPRRRNRVLAFAEQISEHRYLFSFIRRRNFLAFFISRLMNRLISRNQGTEIVRVSTSLILQKSVGSSPRQDASSTELYFNISVRYVC